MTNRCTDRAKRAAVYREAAYRVEFGFHSFSCWAIEDVLVVPLHGEETKEKDKHPLVRSYEKTFRPEACGWTHNWGVYWNGDERRDCRILALCFMAAMVEAGDA